MIWESWSAFWAMGGRGFFVWGSYGALVVAVVAELVALRSARKRAIQSLQDNDDDA
ncbi:MAG TPA: heme exporter protein CcmD [Casimicrobium sp.]|nr:heme exporter protein CcmD [Casimicrobium sp.]